MNQSPIRLLITLVVSIFVSEVAVMIMLSFMPPLSTWGEALFDSTMLVVLLSPLLYMFMFRPLIMHVNEHYLPTEELRQHCDHLEELFAERTIDLAKAIKGLEGEITERKKAEEQLRKLSVAVEQSPSTIVITDTDGKIEYANPKFTQVTGYTSEEAVGENPRIISSGKMPPEVYRDMWETITSGGEWRGELLNKTKEGELYWDLAIISPIINEEGAITHFIAIKENITERKQMEEALREVNEDLRRHIELVKKSQEELIRAEKLAAVGRLTAGVSHEIMNPLNAICLCVSLWKNNPSIPPQLSSDLSKVDEQAQRIVKIAQDLLYFSRQRIPERSLIDLNETVEWTVSFLERELKLSNIQLNLELAEDLPPVFADKDQLHQVVLNLLTNAKDAMPEGGRLRLKTLKTSSQSMNGKEAVGLRVEDSGSGIAPESIDKLFDPFFTTKPEGKGTGLGLSICQGIVKNHGGTIWAENNSSAGTAFIIQLPASHEEKEYKV